VSASVGSQLVFLLVQGANFQQNSVVRWNGQSLTTYPFPPDTLYADVTTAQLDATGTFTITVFTPGGGVSNAVPFTVFQPTPTPSPTPSTTPTPSATPTTPTGPTPTPTLTPTGPTATPTSSPTATRTPANTPTVTPTIGAAPAIVSIQPPSAVVGSAQPAIQITGQNFTPLSVARWNGVPRMTRFVNGQTIVAILNAGDLATAGTIAITVQNYGGAISNAVNFPIVQPTATATPTGPTPTPTTTGTPNPVPVLTSIQPPTSPVESGGAHLTILGADFVPGSVVNVDGASRTTSYFDSTELVVTLNAGDLAVAGTLDITAVNPGPGGGTSNALQYPVLGAAQSVYAPSMLLAYALFDAE
jgi:hypothetical protein